MDMASYNCNGHDGDGDVKMEHKHVESPAVAMDAAEIVTGGGGGRLEYWTPTGKNVNALCGSIIYGDDMLLTKVDSLHSDVRSCWRDLTGASRTSSGTKPFGHGCSLGQQQARATVDEKEYHGRVLKVGGDSEEAAHGGYVVNANEFLIF